LLLNTSLKINYKKIIKQRQQLNIFYKYGFIIDNQIYYENLHQKNTNSRLLILELKNLDNLQQINHFDGIILNYMNPKMYNLNVFCMNLINELFETFIIDKIISNTRFLQTFPSITKSLKQIFIQNYTDNTVELVS
jgi:hypothetical protein